MQSETPVVIYAPQGCGKTRNAAALAAHYEKKVVVDDYDSSQALTPGALHLTNDPSVTGAIPFDQALREASLTPALISVSAPSPVAEEEFQHQQQPARTWLTGLPAWDGQSRLTHQSSPLNPASDDAGPLASSEQPSTSQEPPQSIDSFQQSTAE